jgi:hypothetical protein
MHLRKKEIIFKTELYDFVKLFSPCKIALINNLMIYISLNPRIMYPYSLSKKHLKEDCIMIKKNPEVERIIEKYGSGFDVIYFDGREDGFAEGFNVGLAGHRHDCARKLLAHGVDEKIISECLDIPIDKLKKLKKEI